MILIGHPFFMSW